MWFSFPPPPRAVAVQAGSPAQPPRLPFHPSPARVNSTCKMLSIPFACPASTLTRPPLHSPNALSKFQWDLSLLCMRNPPKGLPAPGNKIPIRGALRRSALPTRFTHTLSPLRFLPASHAVISCSLPASPILSHLSPSSVGHSVAVASPGKSPSFLGWELLSGPACCGHCWEMLCMAPCGRPRPVLTSRHQVLCVHWGTAGGTGWGWEMVGSRWGLISQPFHSGAWGERPAT